MYINMGIILLLAHLLQRSCNKPQLNWLDIFEHMAQSLNVAAGSFWRYLVWITVYTRWGDKPAFNSWFVTCRTIAQKTEICACLIPADSYDLPPIQKYQTIINILKDRGSYDIVTKHPSVTHVCLIAMYMVKIHFNDIKHFNKCLTSWMSNKYQ